MSLLDKNSKKALVESMRHALISSVKSNKALTESVQMESVKFVKEDATYEQLLNMTMNPVRESKYLPDFVMEGAVAIVSEALQSGRKIIGINALTEGAINLVKKTDCVVTEAMLDAAEGIAVSRGLNVVAEAIMVLETKIVDKAVEAVKAGKMSEAEFTKATGKDYKQFTRKVAGGIQHKIEKSKKLKDEIKTLAKQAKGKGGPGGLALKKQLADKKAELAKVNDLVKKGIDINKQSKATAVAKKGLSKNKKIAAGAAIAAGTLAGIAAAKKWHDKKQAEKMAASKTK